MSKPHPTPFRRLTCTDVRFVEVDFPHQLLPCLLIQFSEGISLLLEDQSAIPLATEFREVLLTFLRGFMSSFWCLLIQKSSAPQSPKTLERLHKRF